MELMEDLSVKVRAKRGTTGIRTAAAEIGISHMTLSRIESGKLPDLKTFQLVCRWLELDPNSILGFPSEGTRRSTQSMPVVQFRADKALSPQTAQHLAELILAIQAQAGGTDSGDGS
jgi:DNA-binding Xre family transcriptional regulator